MMKVQDLDVLRPAPRMVRIGGKDVDVSFIPCGITFDIDDIMGKLRMFDRKNVESGGETARQAFLLSVKLCATFCAFKYPELDEDWFMSNVSPQQLGQLTGAIQDALVQAYAGINESKNQTAAKRKK